MYRVSTLLAQCGADAEAVGSTCGLDDADRTPVRPTPRWLTMMWGSQPVAATTLPWAIYVRSDVLAGDKRVLARLLTHELVHVRQWQQLGVRRFVTRYLRGYLAGRRRGLDHHRAYLAIPLEEEARRIAGH
jgi:hypothetical protein